MIIIADNETFISDKMIKILSKKHSDLTEFYKNSKEWKYSIPRCGYYSDKETPINLG